MSTALLSEEAPPPAPKQLPTQVSNLLAFWWLAIGFAAIGAWTAWPLLPSPLTDKETVTGMGQALLWLVFGALLVIGSMGGMAVARGQKLGLTLLKLGALIGMIGTLAVVVLIFLKPTEPNAPSLWDPAPLFNVTLLAIVGLLPFTFGGMALLAASTSDEVRDWFNPPAETPPDEVGGHYVAATEGGGVGEEAAVAAAAGALAFGEAVHEATEDDHGGVAMEEPPAHGGAEMAETIAAGQPAFDAAAADFVEQPADVAAFDQLAEAAEEAPAAEAEPVADVVEEFQMTEPEAAPAAEVEEFAMAEPEAEPVADVVEEFQMAEPEAEPVADVIEEFEMAEPEAVATSDDAVIAEFEPAEEGPPVVDAPTAAEEVADFQVAETIAAPAADEDIAEFVMAEAAEAAPGEEIVEFVEVEEEPAEQPKSKKKKKK